MGGGIISERVAASNRNGWRDHVGIRTWDPTASPITTSKASWSTRSSLPH